MKKSIGLLLLFVSFFFVLTNNMLVLADNITYYTVYSVKKDGTKTQIGEVTDNYENALEPRVDIFKLIKKHENETIDPHLLVPNYLKKTEAEENLNAKRD